MDEFNGVTAIEARVAGKTVRAAEPEMEPEVAVIVADPVTTGVASPVGPIVAIEVADDFQLTEFVRSCVVPSVKVPIAWSCCVVPRGTDAVGGVTAIETKAAGVTDRLVAPVIDTAEALIVVVPTDCDIARPAAETVATVGASNVQAADAVKSSVLPSV